MQQLARLTPTLTMIQKRSKGKSKRALIRQACRLPSQVSRISEQLRSQQQAIRQTIQLCNAVTTSFTGSVTNNLAEGET